MVLGTRNRLLTLPSVEPQPGRDSVARCRTLPRGYSLVRSFASSPAAEARTCSHQRHSIPSLTTPAAAVLVFLDDEDPFLSEQDDVFVAEHGFSAAAAAGRR